MPHPPTQQLTTPRPGDLGLCRLANRSGLAISVLPNGAIFAMEHVQDGQRIMINQSLGSPIAGGMGGVFLRIGGGEPAILPLAGADAHCRVGAAQDCFIWQGETRGIRHEVSLCLQGQVDLWLWRVEVRNGGSQTLPCDVVLIQDLGLGDPGFLMNNEAYASQYLDQHVATHPRMGHVLMGRQNLAQGERHPWVAHGCRERAVGFATDFVQLMGPAHRDGDRFAVPFGTRLASVRLQQETACAALQSEAAAVAPGATTSWTFFGIYRADHPTASADTDLVPIEAAIAGLVPAGQRAVDLSLPVRSILQETSAVRAAALEEKELQERYPRWQHVERADRQLLSFFAPAETCSRHIVLRDKERSMLRRHGALLVGCAQMLPTDSTLCLTCWMHGVFGAQLTLGNTSFHRLFSISRDPYNITRGSGLRMLVDTGEGWRLLTVPSVFEIGLEDCRWIYRLEGSEGRTITVSAVVSGEESAVQWRVLVAGEPCRFLIFAHLVLGEQEFAHAARVAIDPAQKRFMFRPDPQGMWSQRYPQAVYYLVTSTAASIEALGGDELLHVDGKRRSGGYAVMRTLPCRELVFAVVGSLTDPARAAELAARYAGYVDEGRMRASATRYWSHVTRGVRVQSPDADAGAQAIDTILPWLIHDGMVHLVVPHGLEQYNGGAWGTRDVCQGPMELLLALGHDQAAKAILHRVFAQQYAQRGDWPQWFMLEPYSAIQDRQAHGDVIVWPLKALCDYVEASGDFAVLDETVPWRREDDLQTSAAVDHISTHVAKLIATVRASFLPGTSLMRLGNGDWNDALQPVDPTKRDWMVSSWTVALMYEQLWRYAEILRRAGRADGSAEQQLAAAMRADFNRYLVRDGTVAGYGVFTTAGGLPELLLHPHDRRTGIAYSLLPMTQAISGGLFTREQARHHLELIRRHLRFPDGIRLMDRPIAYHGGTQRLFQRAESAAFFGREIGLMYTHAHLRHAQAMAVRGEAQQLWDDLLVVNPIAVTDRLAQASPRQRNAYFSSSDAAFCDRYQASAEWERVGSGRVAVDGGWRIYSSGPGVYTNVLICHALGERREFGVRVRRACLPESLRDLTLKWSGRPASGSPQR